MAKTTQKRSTTSKTKETRRMSTASVSPPAAPETEKPSKEQFPVPENKEDKIKLDTDATEFNPPAGYDSKKHKPLNAKHFADRSHFLVYRAIKAEEDAAKFRQSAIEWRTNGPKKKAEKKAENIMKKVSQLRDQLAGMGMTDAEIDSMLAAAAGKAEG